MSQFGRLQKKLTSKTLKALQCRVHMLMKVSSLRNSRSEAEKVYSGFA